MAAGREIYSCVTQLSNLDFVNIAAQATKMQKNTNNKPNRKKSQPSPSTSDVKLPKIPKISMPEDFKIRTRPLFSLPEEVLKLPAPTSKAAKLQAAKAASNQGLQKRSSGRVPFFPNSS